MRKKLGIILGLAGMMLLVTQTVYAAETTNVEAAQDEGADSKEIPEGESAGDADDIENRIKKAVSQQVFPYMIRLLLKIMELIIFSALIWSLRNLQI